MYRAVELFRWGGSAWLLVGVTLFAVGFAGADWRADSVAAILGVVLAAGLACAASWIGRQLGRAAFGDTAEASTAGRAGRIALLCAAPAIMLVGFVPYPTPYTWLIGIAAVASGFAQLTLALVAARLERRRGARILQSSGGNFVLAR